MSGRHFSTRLHSTFKAADLVTDILRVIKLVSAVG